MTTPRNLCAAQYIRMSTDHQDLSPDMQKAAIEAYATQLCARLRATPARIDGHSIPMSVSIGVAYARGNPSLESLLTIADRFVYVAKAKGRDRWEDHDSAGPAIRSGQADQPGQPGAPESASRRPAGTTLREAAPTAP